MKFTNSPYLYLSIALTLAALAIGYLPQLSDSAVSVRTDTVPPIERGATDVEPAHVASPPPPVQRRGNEEPIFKIAERMPLFPGCDDAGPYAKRKACADKKMLAYIYENVRYPEQAKEAGVQGMAVVSFVVEKDGAVSNVKLVRDPGAGTGREALRTVAMMNVDGLYWTPGRQRGKPVRVQYNLPVKFKLN